MKIPYLTGITAALLLATGMAVAAEPTPAQRRAVDAYAAGQRRAEVTESLVADLNGDGKGEVVAHIHWFEDHFSRLVVFADTGKGLQKVAQSEVGLGLVTRITASGGLIRVEALWRPDSGGMPSVEKTATYRMQGNQVVEVAAQPAVARAASAANAAAPLPPLGLVAGYYTTSGYCRNSTEYFAYDGKRAGMVMQHATDLVPVAALKKKGKWWTSDGADWAVMVETPTRVWVALADETPEELCPADQVPAWVRERSRQ
ncbi:exported hypothetical protein [uncultured Stenotrophomonas sp.]|uniref:Secreted protein n=1 Tax=uncultured Stenotrophomonas sp. TaxID=165438 RepID=A0A1Y5PZD8_9GAMM|nr:exported hypothetical protein [uncultured Stenotrophomonas sp.]